MELKIGNSSLNLRTSNPKGPTPKMVSAYEKEVGGRGYSAYEIAVQEGFVGTEEEWLDSLVGPQGPQGEIGPPGQGEPGPQGPPGIQGEDGFSPTATVTKSGKVATITITDKNGTTTATVSDGEGGSGGGGTWGSIEGTLSDQTDLQNALDAKANTNDLATVATSGSYNDLSNKPNEVSVQTTYQGYVDLKIGNNDYNLVRGSSYAKVEVEVLPVSNTITNNQYLIPTNKAAYDALSNKQDTLVSGTNIKTLNNVSLLGDGNIDLSVIPISGSWGSIVGELANQIDLKNALDEKIKLLSGAYPTYYINKDEHDTANTAFDFSEKPAGLYIAYSKYFYSSPYSNPQLYIKPRASADAFSISGNDIVFIFIPTVLPETYVSDTNVYIIKIDGKLNFYSSHIIDEGNKFDYSHSPVSTAFYYYTVGTEDNQTISGVKTFSALPKSSITPTDDDHLTRKGYVDAQIAALGTVFTLKGSVATENDLPSQNNNVGDVYYVEDVSSGFIWIDDNNTERWEQLGPTVDTSNFLTKTGLAQTTGNSTTNTMSQDAITTALDTKGTYSKPSGGIPSSDMASGVQTSLGKADTAIQPSNTSGLLKNDGTVDTTSYSTFSGNYNDLSNKPTIPTVNNATLTIQKNGTNVETFTANASSNKTANITVPTKLSDFGTVLYNDSNGTGTNSTVTLSESAANFDYLEIYYYASSLHKSEKIYLPNGKKVNLSINAYYQDGNNLYQYFYTKIMNISGTSMTVDKNLEVRFYNKTINNVTQDNRIYIYRVVGYK